MRVQFLHGAMQDDDDIAGLPRGVFCAMMRRRRLVVVRAALRARRQASGPRGPKRQRERVDWSHAEADLAEPAARRRVARGRADGLRPAARGPARLRDVAVRSVPKVCCGATATSHDATFVAYECRASVFSCRYASPKSPRPHRAEPNPA